MKSHEQVQEMRTYERLQLSLLISSLTSASRVSKTTMDWDRAGTGGYSPLVLDVGNRQSTIVSRPSVSVLALSNQNDHIILEEPRPSRDTPEG